jgi:hypothetical protein
MPTTNPSVPRSRRLRLLRSLYPFRPRAHDGRPESAQRRPARRRVPRTGVEPLAGRTSRPGQRHGTATVPRGAFCGVGLDIRSEIANLRSLGIPPHAHGLWITPQRRPVWNQPAQARPVPSDERVQGIDQRSQSARGQHTAGPSREPQLRQQHDAPTPLAGDRDLVATDNPPAFGPSGRRHRGKQVACLLGRKRQEGELLVPVHTGDDPRRPAAEPSRARIEQHGACETSTRRES